MTPSLSTRLRIDFSEDSCNRAAVSEPLPAAAGQLLQLLQLPGNCYSCHDCRPYRCRAYGAAARSASRRAEPEACPGQWSASGEVMRPPVTVGDDITSQTRYVRYQR